MMHAGAGSKTAAGAASTATRGELDESSARSSPARSRIASALSIRRIGAVYVLIAISILFTLWVPETFPHIDTVKQVFNGNAILALAALALIVPLSAGVFDLSTPYTISATGVLSAYLLTHGFSVAEALAAAMLAALCIGVINGIVVVGMRIDSFIGTLATGSLIMAAITAVSGDNNISGTELTGFFASIAQTVAGPFTLPVYYALGLTILLWYFLGHTATGRRLYATGFNSNAARLAGISTDRLRFSSLLASASIAGATGIIFASSVGAGSPTAGNPYLLPAFSAVFLGATQLTEGRFNAWGTIIAVVLLGVGTTGLVLAEAPTWSQSAFVGVVLIAALGITGRQRQKAGASSLWSRRWRGRRGGPGISGDAGHSDPTPEAAARPGAGASDRRTYDISNG